MPATIRYLTPDGLRSVAARLLVVVSVLMLLASTASARIIRVGAQESVKTIAEAARQAKDDDIIEITSGDYVGDVVSWRQKRLTIRGVGQRPVLWAAMKIADGKAIWVFRNGDFNVSNIEFRGARARDGNGAGIRFEKGKLNVSHCAFFDNQIGIMTANFQEAELNIEASIFGQAPKQKSPLPHLLYVGQIEKLRVVGSRFHGGHNGHLLKSRARFSDVRYNLLVDGDGGTASYEAEFPNGGDVTLVGNVIAQSSSTENWTMVAFGSEGGGWPRNRLRMVHNTLYSDGWRPARFLRVFESKLSSPPEIMTRSNLLAGIGIFETGVDGVHQDNFHVWKSDLGAPSVMDFSLNPKSDLVGKAHAISPDPASLQPQFEHRVPGAISAIPGQTKWTPGAIQTYGQGN